MKIFVIFLLLLTSCEMRISNKTEPSKRKLAMKVKVSCDTNECPCDTPSGIIPHGGKILVYSKDKVQCNEGCNDYSEELICNNGKFNKDISKYYFKCDVEECPACVLGKNLIFSGESIEVFSKEEVGCKESCDDYKEIRHCNMGVLSGSDEFKYFSCKRKVCRCNLPDNSGYISLDGKITLYSSEIAECGKKCEIDLKAERTCVLKKLPDKSETFELDNDPKYRFRTCQEREDCFCNLPSSMTPKILDHNQSIKVYEKETVPCGESCDTVDNIEVKCENGIFKIASDTTITVDFSNENYSKYKYACRVEDCNSCPIEGSVSVPHGGKYQFAKSEAVPCSQECEFSEKTCNNGEWVGGDPTFTEAHCVKGSCKCNVPEMAGVTVAVGNSYRFFRFDKAPCGKTCLQNPDPPEKPFYIERKCIEDPVGTYFFKPDSEYIYSKCEISTSCECDLPGGLGKIYDKAIDVLTSQSTPVACGESCDEVPSVTVRCDNGILVNNIDGSIIDINTTPYRYHCRQETCKDCTLPGYGTLSDGQSITLYSKETYGCGEEAELFTYRFSCLSGVLFKGNVQFNPSNSPTSWYTSITRDCPGCPLPWGGSISEGSSINAYKYSGVVINNCGRGCKMIERKCKNGVLEGDPSYDMKKCDNKCSFEGGGAPPRACLLPWQNSFVTPDSQIPMWSKKTVPCNDSCQTYFKLGRCNMKTGNFNPPFDYIYQTCTEICP